ncbi:hypothetical protein [Thalassobellus suaedae]|uniref:Uncharacterized protein n=1 Tax=Thalassobellus suaedae TaxID=3074124 RepID=A0ABY9XW87_9FLAO|nr:hypothetical protein RHP51_04770 [Flavobacteriaceae bacterium HL-DH14]
MNKQTKLKTAFLYAVLVVWATSCTDSSFKLRNQNNSVVINETYLYSHDWDTPDPFEKIEIDTVKVLDIKDGYVKWQEKGKSYYLSGELKYFKHHIKPCN